MSIIEVENLTKIYDKRFSSNSVRALNNVSLSLEEGIVFGLLGPNGAGKTTLIKILLDIVFPTAGSFKMFNSGSGNVSLKKNVGYLPENHKYPAYLTGEAVLRFFGELGGCEKSKLDERVDYLLDLVKMTKWRKTKIKKYSKGMMQRLGLAQALMNDPKIVFLDEPTDGVDPIGRMEIREILKTLKSEGKTIFLNSHLLSEVEMISDSVAILNKGELVWNGSVEELTSKNDSLTISVEDEVISEQRESLLQNKAVINIDNKTISVSVKNTAELNSLIDLLRELKINIVSVIPKKSSLEEMFITIINKSDSEAE